MVADLGLPQTVQYTDGIDRQYDIFNDIFFDSDDIHYRASDKNHYGPVLFVFNIDILLYPGISLWITKSNPSDWPTVAVEDKYFSCSEEFIYRYSVGTFCQMITIKNCNGFLPFNGYLHSVVVDGLQTFTQNHQYNNISERLCVRSTQGSVYNLSGIINQRVCIDTCKCASTYSKLPPARINSLFG